MKRENPPSHRVLTLAIGATMLAALVAFVSSASPAHGRAATSAAPAPAPGGAPAPARPNIVFVLTDDLTRNLLRFMPEVRRMQRQGATFTNYFVTSSLCCSSRTSIFTGKYPHNTGVLQNTPPQGGYQPFRKTVGGRTFAPNLERSGYTTALMGKFLNGYRAGRGRPQRGWSAW